MISEVLIENFKSVQDLKLSLGRITVLIGENGGGKSNILEALAMASASANNKLDNEFMVSRGIRVTEPDFMRSAFEKRERALPIGIEVRGDNKAVITCQFELDGKLPYSRWLDTAPLSARMAELTLSQLRRTVLDAEMSASVAEAFFEMFREDFRKQQPLPPSLPDFLIYSPENTSLRTFEREGQILPLGIKGEGLFKLLKMLSDDAYRERLEDIKTNLGMLDWYKDFRIPKTLVSYEQALEIGDRHLHADLAFFDQRSANEGFLFLLFYFALFVSPNTPSFFAIDNIDASLNPKLCSELVKRLVVLAEKYHKQVVMTTHNPAVLDGLNLHDDAQRLYVIRRNSKGFTQAKRVTAPKPIGDEPPIKLSEAFLRGIIGGLPKNF